MHSIAADPRTGLSVDSAQFRKQAPRTQLSDDPDTATEQTVQEMCRQIHQAALDPLVQRCAVNAVRNFRGGPAWIGMGIDPFSNAQCMAESCWWWCKHFLKFKHHGSMFEAWSSDLGDPRTKLQLLIAPDVLVRMSRMEGDCAIYTMMLCAMLESLGVPFQIVTLAVDEMQPTIFSHVFVRAAGESLDASHGPYPGWQAPAEDIHREWVFDMTGRRVGESPRFQGLHAYRARAGMGRLGRLRRGFGDMVCDETGFCYDDGTGTSTAAPTTASTLTYAQLLAAGNPACTCVNGTCAESGDSCSSPLAASSFCPDGTYATASGGCASGAAPVSGYTAPAQNSAQWASFATQLMKSGMTLAEINAIQPGTVVSANGAILRQSTGLPVPVGGTSTFTTALGTMSSSTLMIGALVIGAILFMSKGGR